MVYLAPWHRDDTATTAAAGTTAPSPAACSAANESRGTTKPDFRAGKVA